jgi:hypothetical protein
MMAITTQKRRTAMLEIKAGEGMETRLHRKLQHTDRSTGTHYSLVAADTVGVDSKYMIKVSSTINESLEMNSIFFAPKHGRHT